MKIIAVVPTFNRPKLLLKNIKCLLQQTHSLDGLVVVDNASRDETRQALETHGFMSHPKIKYVRLNDNIGSSGGFRVGMETAMTLNADWIWGMDDDAFPRSDALQNLLSANKADEFDCLWSNVDEDTEFDGPTKVVTNLIFVGYLVSRRLVETIGYPDQRFYMYHDDTEYSMRIVQHNFTILKVRDSIIDHAGYDKRGVPAKVIDLPFGRFRVLSCEPYRVYYIYRNTYFLYQKKIRRLKYIFINLMINVPLYLLFKPKSAAALILGVAHAAINKRGFVKLPDKFFRK